MHAGKLIEGRLRVLIEGINRHSTEDALNTHDPLCLVHLLSILSKTKKTRALY